MVVNLEKEGANAGLQRVGDRRRLLEDAGIQRADETRLPRRRPPCLLRALFVTDCLRIQGRGHRRRSPPFFLRHH